MLSEIRKVLEQLQPCEIQPFGSLKFFCNWALHSRIDQRSSQKRIQELCDVFDLHNIHARRLITTDFLNTMMMLRPFQESLARFFGAFSICPEITHNRYEWYRFLYHYSGVISDVPLIRTESVPADEVREVTVGRVKNSSPGWPDFIQWKVMLGDGSPRWASTQLGLVYDANQNLIRIDPFLIE